ncbi:hypothetical protein E2C01_082738 [Portunus trituberculatus]|uniref:Uncharacterized protein n=1 Tax=Portunus trituberculatus TaxID=210409 RepID=A0A5B7IZX3_PORTR|nr:hypothetical protein [Portunus trituberculatus]
MEGIDSTMMITVSFGGLEWHDHVSVSCGMDWLGRVRGKRCRSREWRSRPLPILTRAAWCLVASAGRSRVDRA